MPTAPTTNEHTETARLLSRATPEFRRIYQAFRQSGARPNELCRAQIADIHSNSGGHRTLVLTEHKTVRKTGRPRRIAIDSKLARIIDRAIGCREGYFAFALMTPVASRFP